MQLKQIPADFRVRELLDFTRDDQGPFFVHRLRKHFEDDPRHPLHFHTVRGVGYRFTAEAEE